MTVEEMINTLYHDKPHLLNDWEKNFIEELFYALGDTGTPDEEIDEYLTPNQIEKVKEIWEDYQ